MRGIWWDAPRMSSGAKENVPWRSDTGQSLPLLEKEYRRPLTEDSRIGIVFVAAQFGDKAAVRFLRQAWGAASEQAHQAEEGLRVLGEAPRPP